MTQVEFLLLLNMRVQEYMMEVIIGIRNGAVVVAGEGVLRGGRGCI